MKLATLRTAGGGTRAVRVEDDRLVDLGVDDLGQLLAQPGWEERAATAQGTVHDEVGAAFAPVVPRPGKIVCVGLNYRSHILEMGRDLPDHPTLFAKFTDALVGARDQIVLPAVSEKVDWEVELALVIGRTVRHADPAEAAGAIAGFTVANDVSMRDWQNRTPQWLQGKTFEHATPVGPWLVTPDEVGGAAPDLELTCAVDGVVRQRSRTAHLVFGPAAIVA